MAHDFGRFDYDGERLLEVQSRNDFRAVVQMRAQLEEMSNEIVMTSFANGTRRRPHGGPTLSAAQADLAPLK